MASIDVAFIALIGVVSLTKVVDTSIALRGIAFIGLLDDVASRGLLDNDVVLAIVVDIRIALFNVVDIRIVLAS